MGRVYDVGGKLRKIPQKVVDKIIEWNSGPERDDVRFDKKICHSLLLSLVHKEQLRDSLVDDDTLEFIKGNFSLFHYTVHLLPILKTKIIIDQINDNVIKLTELSAL